MSESLPQVRSLSKLWQYDSLRRKYWWKHICEDNLLFHSTLQLSALDLVKRRGRQDLNPSHAQLSVECVKLLRNRIEESQDGISDYTLAAIVFLLVVEVFLSCFFTEASWTNMHCSTKEAM